MTALLFPLPTVSELLHPCHQNISSGAVRVYTGPLLALAFLFCLSRNWNLPSRELAAILSRRNTHASTTPALYPGTEGRTAAPPPPGEEAHLRPLPRARPLRHPLLPLAEAAL